MTARSKSKSNPKRHDARRNGPGTIKPPKEQTVSDKGQSGIPGERAARFLLHYQQR